jgi:hypothetical protein
MSRENLITETSVQCIPVAWPCSGNRRDRNSSEGERILRGLQALCSVDDDFPLLIAGRAHFPVRGASGTEFSQRLDGGCQGAIVLSPDKHATSWVRISFKLVRGRGSEAWLTVECNPTTLLVGNNVHPATFADDDGCFDSYPSSASRAVAGLLRIGFRVLDDLIGQATNSSTSVFDVATRKAIKTGHVHIVRAQYCAYLPCGDVPHFLQLMAVMFGQTIGDGGGIISLAELLGLEYKLYTNPETHQVTGIMLIKKQGKNPLYSLVFYDKDVRVRQMRQRSSLPIQQVATITENVRFDITLHSLGIKEIVRHAQKWLEKIPDEGSRDRWARWRQSFARDEPESNALSLRRAILILSRRRDGAGGFERRSFADWLVPFMLREVLHLDVTVGFTADDLDRLLRLDHPVARAWANGPIAGGERWSNALASDANCREGRIYRLRKEWRDRFKIDIRRPYAYYRDLLHFGPRSLTTPRERQALLDAVLDKSGDDAVRLLGKALDRFEADRTKVVGATINARPVALPFDVAENVLTTWSCPPESARSAAGSNTAYRETPRLEPRRDRDDSRRD